MQVKEPTLADDLLEGVSAISEFTGIPRRRCFYLAERKLLPIVKVGGRWTARKSTLRAHYEKLEAGAS